MSRLDLIDASFHYASTDVSRDQYVVLAFGWPDGTPASFADMSAFMRARAARVPELRKRLQEVPGNLDYPRWVRDEQVVDDPSRIVEMSPRTWTDALRTLAELVQTPLDATDAPWRVHVAPRVEGVPHASGAAAVVVCQVSHALTDGQGASRLARLLFSPTLDAIPASLDDAASPGSQLPVALASLVALPFRLAWARLRAVRAHRAFARDRETAPEGRDAPRPSVRGNADPTTDRVVHVVPTPPGCFAPASFSVTTLALTAVSVATDRYLSSIGDSTPDTLNALVPVALPAHIPWSAKNRIVNGTVDLHVDVDDLTERAAAIRESLRTARDEVVDPLLTSWISAENTVPAPVFLAIRKLRDRRAVPTHNEPESVLTNVTVISVNRGDGRLDLCGAAPLFTAGFPMLGANRSISHGFYGLGDTVTVCFTACPDTFPDHARYAEILAAAVADVVAATRADI